MSWALQFSQHPSTKIIIRACTHWAHSHGLLHWSIPNTLLAGMKKLQMKSGVHACSLCISRSFCILWVPAATILESNENSFELHSLNHQHWQKAQRTLLVLVVTWRLAYNRPDCGREPCGVATWISFSQIRSISLHIFCCKPTKDLIKKPNTTPKNLLRLQNYWCGKFNIPSS